MSSVHLPDRIAARIAAFSLVGLANGVVGIGGIVIANLAGARPIIANMLGYTAGLLVSFTLNSRVTFHSRAVDRYTVLRFLCAFAASFACNLLLVGIAQRLLDRHNLLASLAGTPLYIAMFYLLCEYWVFRPQGNNA